MLHHGDWPNLELESAARGTTQGKCVASGEVGGSAVEFACFDDMPPNMRVQRTRRLASLGRSLRSLGSPLTRKPLGATRKSRE
jgi:hypothetical protein